MCLWQDGGRFYFIEFDDSDDNIVPETYVYNKEDYDQDRRYRDKQSIGIYNYFDHSEDATEWNNKRGWWQTDLTGAVCFDSVVTAMRAYDDYFVRINGRERSINPNELNLPGEWTFPSQGPPTPLQQRDKDMAKRNPIENASSSSNISNLNTSSETPLSIRTAAQAETVHPAASATALLLNNECEEWLAGFNALYENHMSIFEQRMQGPAPFQHQSHLKSLIDDARREHEQKMNQLRSIVRSEEDRLNALSSAVEEMDQGAVEEMDE